MEKKPWMLREGVLACRFRLLRGISCEKARTGSSSLDANGLDGGCCDGDDVATGAGAGADVDDLVLGAEEGLCGECCGLDEGFQGGVEWRELRGLRRLVGWRWYFVWWFRFVW